MRQFIFVCAATSAAVLIAFLSGWGSAQAEAKDRLPQRVTFLSADGHTRLVGYLYMPAHMVAARAPAVVMMHGRAGAYSSQAHGVYGAATPSPRHKW